MHPGGGPARNNEDWRDNDSRLAHQPGAWEPPCIPAEDKEAELKDFHLPGYRSPRQTQRQDPDDRRDPYVGGPPMHEHRHRRYSELMVDDPWWQEQCRDQRSHEVLIEQEMYDRRPPIDAPLYDRRPSGSDRRPSLRSRHSLDYSPRRSSFDDDHRRGNEKFARRRQERHDRDYPDDCPASYVEFEEYGPSPSPVLHGTARDSGIDRNHGRRDYHDHGRDHHDHRQSGRRADSPHSNRRLSTRSRGSLASEASSRHYDFHRKHRIHGDSMLGNHVDDSSDSGYGSEAWRSNPRPARYRRGSGARESPPSVAPQPRRRRNNIFPHHQIKEQDRRSHVVELPAISAQIPPPPPPPASAAPVPPQIIQGEQDTFRQYIGRDCFVYTPPINGGVVEEPGSPEHQAQQQTAPLPPQPEYIQVIPPSRTEFNHPPSMRAAEYDPIVTEIASPQIRARNRGRYSGRRAAPIVQDLTSLLPPPPQSENFHAHAHAHAYGENDGQRHSHGNCTRSSRMRLKSRKKPHYSPRVMTLLHRCAGVRSLLH